MNSDLVIGWLTLFASSFSSVSSYFCFICNIQFSTSSVGWVHDRVFFSRFSISLSLVFGSVSYLCNGPLLNGVDIPWFRWSLFLSRISLCISYFSVIFFHAIIFCWSSLMGISSAFNPLPLSRFKAPLIFLNLAAVICLLSKVIIAFFLLWSSCSYCSLISWCKNVSLLSCAVS